MSYHILIIDDEIEVATMLQSFLRRKSYQADYCLDGADAIDMIRDHAGHQPDLILLDINMPQVDGIEVCRAIRNIVSCPILFLTARDQDADKVEGFAAGGDDYIVKPFSLTELNARIEAHLRRERREKVIQRKIFEEITIDYSAREIFVQGQKVHFNRKEYASFIANAGHHLFFRTIHV